MQPVGYILGIHLPCMPVTVQSAFLTLSLSFPFWWLRLLMARLSFPVMTFCLSPPYSAPSLGRWKRKKGRARVLRSCVIPLPTPQGLLKARARCVKAGCYLQRREGSARTRLRVGRHGSHRSRGHENILCGGVHIPGSRTSSTSGMEVAQTKLFPPRVQDLLEVGHRY